MFKHIKEEFAVIQDRDPAIKSPMEVILYPSFKVMIVTAELINYI